MSIYDATLTMKADLPPWPGDPPFSHQAVYAICQGDPCNVSKITMSSHFGTHIDAPYHFDDNGMRVDRIPLDDLMGSALVHEVETPDIITLEHLPDLTGVERILFKTSNGSLLSDSTFHPQYVSLDLETARYLVRSGIRLVGIDYYSIEAYDAPGDPVHHELCGNGIILLEGVDLRHIPPGWYELIALPLKIEGCDASPCRIVLRD